MANIDSLSIEITANSADAQKALNKLSKGINALNKSLQGADIAKLTQLVTAMKGLSSLDTKSVNNVKNLSNSLSRLSKSTSEINTSKFVNLTNSIGRFTDTTDKSSAASVTKLANALARLSKTSNSINSGGMNNMTSSVTTLVRSVGNSGDTVNATTRLTNALTRLSKASASGDSTNLNKMTGVITKFSNSITTSSKDISIISRLTSSLARLASAGNNTQLTANALPGLATALSNFFTTMSKATVVSAETVTLTTAIAQLASAGSKAEKTASALNDLGDKTLNFIKKLSTAPEVKANTIQLVSALGNLANAGSKANGIFNSISGGGRKASGIFSTMKGYVDKLTNSFKNHNAQGKGLVSTIGLLYAKYFILIRAFKALGSAIESSMNYVETLNYFDNSLASMKETATDNWSEIGYASADAYYSSFQSRAETLTAKMSGYNITSSGSLSATGSASLGIDPNTLMNYQSVFGQMSKSLGLTSDNASRLSQALTEIGGDMASLYNKSFTDVWDDLQSGITGMARTWDKYGTNIRVANLQEYATNLGIQQTVSTMSQADKVLLRTIVLLDSQRAAWTDLSSTINQPANQLRMVKAQFSNLSREIGNIFLPLVAAILPYVNALLICLNKLASAAANFITALTGYDLRSLTGTYAGSSDALSDLLDDTNDVTDATEKATKAAKEWENQLMGFDEINKLTDSSDTDTSGTSGSGDTGSNGALQDAFNAIYDEYQKAWDKAYDSMDNKAQQIAKKLQTALVKAWKTGDGSNIGKSIATWLNKGIKYASQQIPTFTSTLNKLAKVLGTSVDGFIKKFSFATLGTTVGKAIKGVLEAKNTFYNSIDWTNLGTGISRSLNNFVKSGVLKSYAKTLASKFRAIIETAFGAVKNFDFASLGDNIGDAISTFFKDMGKKNSKTGLSGWQELGETISDSISGLADSLTHALNSVDWASVGKAIAQMLASIKWLTILKSVANAIWTALGSLLTAQFASGSAVVAIATGLAEVAASLKLFNTISGVASKITTLFTAIKPFFTFLKANPYVAIIAGIAGLVTVLGKFQSANKTIKVYTDLNKTETDLENLKEDIEDVQDAISDFNSNQSDIEAEYGAIDDLADSYYKLSKKTNKSNEEQALMKSYAKTLTEKIPDLQGVIDDTTGAYKGTYDQLKQTIAKTKEYYMLQAAQDDLVEIGKSMYKAQKSLNTATTDYNANVKKLNELKAEKAKIDNTENNVVTTNAKKYEALVSKIETYEGKVKSSKEELTKQQTVMKGLETDYSNATKYVGELSGSYDGLSDSADEAKTSVDNVTKSASGKTVGIKVTANTKGFSKSINSALEAKEYQAKIKAKFVTNSSSFDNLKGLVADIATNFSSGKKTSYTFQDSKGVVHTVYKAGGGLYTNGKWHNITQYASGGLPSQGQMFVAREAGPELVGNIGNSTAVINNDQIVASVAKGVASAVEVAMRNANSSNGGNYLQANIEIDGQKVMQSILTQARTYKQRTNGQNVFMAV